MIDSDVQALLQALVDKLKGEGHISSPRVQAAFQTVPRHLFIPNEPLDRIYSDQAIPTKILDGVPVSSSSQPAIMAIMLEQLGLRSGQRVLEIGAGTGYNAALMAQIVGKAGHVTTLDLDQDIVDDARNHLTAAGLANVQVVCVDGARGYAENAPYDRIILTVAAGEIAPGWQEQLMPGGRLVLPLAVKRGAQKSVAFMQENGHLASASVVDCGFMMLRGIMAEPHAAFQLGPEPGLLLTVDSSRQLEPNAVYQLLTGPYHSCSTAIKLSTKELWGGLGLWLALRVAEACDLSAFGEMVARNTVHGLFRWTPNFSSTMGLVDSTSICLLASPGDLRASENPIKAKPFDLIVQSYGSGDSLANQLIDEIIAWDQAGRPGNERIHIRSYSQDAIYVASPDEIVINKRWTRLVLDWH